jgi:hypothetical protein
MKKKTSIYQLMNQMVHEEGSKKASRHEQTNEPCVFLGKPTIDPAYQKQMKRRKKRANQPYFPALDSLDVPPLICPLEFEEEQDD